MLLPGLHALYERIFVSQRLPHAINIGTTENGACEMPFLPIIDHIIVIDPSRLVLRQLPPLASAASFLRQLLLFASATSFRR